MSFWEKVKRDLRKGIKDGIEKVVEGTTFVREKAEELTEEGKKKYRAYELNQKVQREIAELGGKVYDLTSTMENPLEDGKVKAAIARIRKLEAQIMKLEKVAQVSRKKEPVKKAGTGTSRRKKAAVKQG